MTLEVTDFTKAAHGVPDAAPLKLTGQGVATMGWLHRVCAWKSTHRRVLSEFFEALTQKYGEGIADMAGGALHAALRAGEPLTARKVREIVSEAEAIERNLSLFFTGLHDANGQAQPFPHNLDAALKTWFATHPAKPPLSEAELIELKLAIVQELREGRPPCLSLEQMYSVVEKGYVAPLKGLAALFVDLSPDSVHKAWERFLPPLAAGENRDPALRLSAAELDALRQEITFQTAEACRGGVLPFAFGGNARALVMDRVFNDLKARLRQIARPEIAPALQENLRRALFVAEADGVPRLCTSAQLAQAIEREQRVAYNPALAERFSRHGEAEFRQAAVAALQKCGISVAGADAPLTVNLPHPDDATQTLPCDIAPTTLATLGSAVRARILAEDRALTEKKAGEIRRAVLADWAKGIATAARAIAITPENPQPPRRALRVYLMQQQLTQAAWGGAAYVAHVLLNPPAIDPATLTALMEKDNPEDWSGALLPYTAAPQAMVAALPEAIQGGGAVMRSVIESDAAILGVLALDLDRKTATALYERLDDSWGRAFKSRLTLAGNQDSRNIALLEAMASLHQALGFRLGLTRVQESSAFRDYPVAASDAELPLLARSPEAPRFTADAMLAPYFQSRAPEAVRAYLNAQFQPKAEEMLALRSLMCDDVHMLVAQRASWRRGDPDYLNRHSQFEKDLARHIYVIAGRERLATREAIAGSPEERTWRIAQQGCETLARFLFGETAALDALSPEQQAQVFILASVSNQRLEVPLFRAAQCAVSETLAREAVYLSTKANDATRALHLTRSDNGDIILDYAATFAYGGCMPEAGEMIELDKARSCTEVLGRFVLPRAELERLGRLDWLAYAEQGKGHETYLPDLRMMAADASLALHLARPEAWSRNLLRLAMQGGMAMASTLSASSARKTSSQPLAMPPAAPRRAPGMSPVKRTPSLPAGTKADADRSFSSASPPSWTQRASPPQGKSAASDESPPTISPSSDEAREARMNFLGQQP